MSTDAVATSAINTDIIATAALWVAIYGGALSTALAVVRAVSWFERRRGKIRVIVRDFLGRDAKGQPMRGAEFVCFEAVNDGEKPVQITGLVLRVGEHEIDLTPYSGTPNLTVISEGEDYSRLIAREELLHAITEKTGQRHPYKCVAALQSRARRWYKKRFTLNSEGVQA